MIYLENGRQIFAGDIESFRSEYRIVLGERYKIDLLPEECNVKESDQGRGMCGSYDKPYPVGNRNEDGLCCQTVFAIAFMHTFSIGNILLPLAVNFLFPVLYIGILTTIQV